MYPFGMRVLVKVDPSDLKNIGADNVLTGTVIELGSVLKPDYLDKILSNTEINPNILLYIQAAQKLNYGTEVTFCNEPKLVNADDGVYNVPVEMIRSYKK